MSRVIIDVREPEEFAQNHIAGALNVPVNRILKAKLKIDMGSEIILYCRSGARSERALKMLASLGYTNLYNGINAESIKSKFGIDLE